MMNFYYFYYSSITESILASTIAVWFAAVMARHIIHLAEKVTGFSLPSVQELYIST